MFETVLEVGNNPQHYCLTQLSHQQVEAVAQRCYVKKVFLKISKNSQEDTRARVSFLIKL